MGPHEYGIPVRSSVLDRVYNVVECDLFPDLPGATTSTRDGIRCLGPGLQSEAQHIGVHSAVEIQCPGSGLSRMELMLIILAAAPWGRYWRGHRMTCHCDNQVVVAFLCSHSSSQPSLMHLIRCLVYIEARFGFTVHPTYIDTKSNHLADDLSRNRLNSFVQGPPSRHGTGTNQQQPPQALSQLTGRLGTRELAGLYDLLYRDFVKYRSPKMNL